MVGTVTGADGAQEAVTYYLKLSVTPQHTGTVLTCKEGYTYGVVGGYIVDAQEGLLTSRYGQATVAFAGWFENAACTDECEAADLAQIKASTDSTKLTFTVGGKDSDAGTDGVQTRLRVSLTAPTNDAVDPSNEQKAGNFGLLFGDTLGNTVDIEVTWSDGGTSVQLNGGSNDIVYYAISGTDTLQTKAQADAIIGTSATAESNTTVEGKTNISAKCVLEVK